MAERIKTVTQKRKYIACDFCYRAAHNQEKCVGCDKDLCEKCMAHYWYENPWTREDLNGYSEWLCPNCYDIFKEQEKKIEELHSNLSKLYELWRKKCKINRPT